MKSAEAPPSLNILVNRCILSVRGVRCGWNITDSSSNNRPKWFLDQYWSASDVPPGNIVETSVELDVPDAGAAMQTQTELMNTGDLGPYDKVLNSCVSHVCDILNAAGVETPAAQGSAQLKFLLNLLKGG